MTALLDLELLVKSRYPIIAVETYEEERLTTLLHHVGARLKIHVYQWAVGGAVRRLGMVGDVADGAQSPQEALRSVAALGDGIFHLKDLHRYLEDVQVVRRLLDLTPDFEQDRRSIVLSATRITLPADLERRAAFFRFELPTLDELRGVAKSVVDALKRDQKVRVELSPEDFDRLIERLKGMTLFEAEHALTRTILRDQALDRHDLDEILEIKKELLAKEGLIEYVAVEENLASVGGFKTLKAWLAKRRRAYTPEAKAFGIAPPKGILLCGCQGCGKSLAAKAVAQDWGLPLLKLEAGSLFDKFIGESEKNLERALTVAEDLAPCVLMVDEIEKAFPSVGNSEADAGLSRRIFGRLLGWLQDRKAPVFVVATSNAIDQLPPELIRKGRFDEIFFIDLPSKDERAEIFAIHLTKRKRQPSAFDIRALADASEGFSGAEIEQIVVSGLYTAFSRSSEVTTEILLEEIQATRPLSVTRHEDIAALREWAQGRAVMAS